MAKGKATKYTVTVLIKAFREAATFRGRLLKAGFTDNGGAIHSAERILHILGQRLSYPHLSHLNHIKKSEYAVLSVAALNRVKRKQSVLIEHVAPHRALTTSACDRAYAGVTDRALKNYIRRRYRLVLLTPHETKRLNAKNRSRIDRLRLDGIKLVNRRGLSVTLP